MAQRPQPSLRLADGGSFITRWAQSVMRPDATAKRLREADAPPPPPAAPASAPVRAPAPPPPNPNATPDNPAGIRFQDGGHVPGTGRGDKIPAKYEPGEFVVSNDMIDDNPGLREQLSGLRADTLAARGKTVEEADAKALRYHGGLRGGAHGQETRDEELQGVRRHAERGVEGVGDSTAYARRSGSGRGEGLQRVTLRAAEGFPGIDVTERPWQGSADSRLFARDPGPGNPNVGRAAPPVAAPIEPAAPAAPKAPGAASRLLGSADDWKNFASGPADSPYKTLRMTPPSAPSSAPGMVGKAAGVLGKAAGVAQGAVGVYDAYKGIQEGDAQRAGAGAADALAAGALFTPAAPVAGAYLGLRGAWDTGKAIYDNLGEGTQNVIGGTVNQIGLNTGLWGVDDSAKMQLDAAAPTALRKTAPGAPTQTRPEDTSAGPPESAAQPAVSQNSLRRIDAPGQSPLFTNVPDGGQFGNDSLMSRGQISAQSMAAADALAGSQLRESMGRVQAAQSGGASPASLRRERLMDQLQSRELGARKTARLGLAAMDQQEQAANQRYATDSSLRGQMYTADTQLGAKQMEMQRGLRQQQLKGEIFRAAGGKPEAAAQIAASYGLDAKDFTDMASASQTRDHNATTNARKRLEGMAVRSDDKGGTVVDPGRLARLESTLGKMAPGWQHMSEPEQAKHLATAEASVNLLEGLNDRRNNGFWQSIGVDGSSASLDKLPIEAMKGGRLKTVKALEGAFTGGGVERKDYVIETGDGHKLYLPRDKVNQGELELLKSRGVDISSLQK